MESPAPVNLNALKGILANAKKVMNKVEEDKPVKTKNVDSRGLTESYEPTNHYSESDEKEMNFGSFTPKPSAFQPQMYTTEQVMASKLPANIKEAMIKTPIPQLQGPPSKFTLDDLSDLVEKPQPKNNFKSTSVPLNESIGGSYQQPIMVDPSVLKNMIKEAVAEYFKESYEKKITEAAISKTINLLIKEGKIQTKKKI
jgi:hypothetical protein